MRLAAGVIAFCLSLQTNAFPPSGGRASGYARNNINTGSFNDLMVDKLRRMKPTFDRLWTEKGTVPRWLERVPDEPLFFMAGDIKVHPDSPLYTSQLDQNGDRLKFFWNADPNALYTLMFEDPIPHRPFKFIHYMVGNIPGNNVDQGEVIFDLLPNFTFDEQFDENGENGFLNVTARPLKENLVLVYKQNGRIDFDPKVSGCSPAILNRATSHEQLEEKYNLEGPVAGTFFNLPYEPGWTEYFLCYFGSCTGQKLPDFDIKGVNDNLKPDASTCRKPFQYNNRWWHQRFFHY